MFPFHPLCRPYILNVLLNSPIAKSLTLKKNKKHTCYYIIIDILAFTIINFYLGMCADCKTLHQLQSLPLSTKTKIRCHLVTWCFLCTKNVNNRLSNTFARQLNVVLLQIKLLYRPKDRQCNGIFYVVTKTLTERQIFWKADFVAIAGTNSCQKQVPFGDLLGFTVKDTFKLLV